jgi:16S rRNA (cytosine1402-N4)-methyltransferase
LMATGHYPVMLEEALEALAPKGDETIVDATFGGGGHSRRILEELGPGGSLIAIDRDPGAADRAAELREDPRFSFRAGSYDEVLEGLVGEGAGVDGVLFDLGLSSFQIDEAERGFSYVQEGPLDMRMDPTSGRSAADFLNLAEPAEISDVLVRYGDVPRGEARRIAREIAKRRPLETTVDLAGAVRSAVGWKERGGNPSKKVFQAVRVYVNDELGGLERALDSAEKLLVPGGRLVAIAFHSGEDRAVKRFIKDREGRCVCPPELPVCACGAEPTLRRGVVRKPSAQEVAENPRSGSARLRSATRTNEQIGGRR